MDENYIKSVLKTWWGIYAEYNDKLNNVYIPQWLREIYKKRAAEAKECAEAWEDVFFVYGYYTIHLHGGEIEVVDVNNLDELPF